MTTIVPVNQESTVDARLRTLKRAHDILDVHGFGKRNVAKMSVDEIIGVTRRILDVWMGTERVYVIQCVSNIIIEAIGQEHQRDHARALVMLYQIMRDVPDVFCFVHVVRACLAISRMTGDSTLIVAPMIAFIATHENKNGQFNTFAEFAYSYLPSIAPNVVSFITHAIDDQNIFCSKCSRNDISFIYSPL